MCHAVTLIFASNIGPMNATTQEELTFCFWWDPANMKVSYFDEAVMSWHFKDFRHSGTGRGGRGEVSATSGLLYDCGLWAGLHLSVLAREQAGDKTQNMLALLCLSTSAEEHVLLQDKSFPPPFDH